MTEYAQYNDTKKAAFKAGFGKTEMTFTDDGRFITHRASYEMPIGDGKTFTCEEVTKESKFRIIATSKKQIVLEVEIPEEIPEALRGYKFLTIFIEDDDTISIPHNNGVFNMSLPGREYFRRQKH